MAVDFTPTKEDMEWAQIVLDDALPYELNMLDASLCYMQSAEFGKLANSKNQIEWLIYNGTLEAFWTHARCVIEFFNRTKNGNFTASSASARDFTDGFVPSAEMQELFGPGRLSQMINEQVSHVGFCRKAEQLQKLNTSHMVRVKSIIDKEVKEFDRTLRREFREYWKARHAVPLLLELLNQNVSSTATWSGSWTTTR